MSAVVYLTLLRPHQWIKNLFLVAPMLFSFNLTLYNIIKVFEGILIFSLCASAVYVFNDIHDLNEDRQHPEKSKRPIASGEISISTAFILTIIIYSISLGLALWFNKGFFSVIIVYTILNILYTLKLKHIPILDIVIIAIGFILRLYAGAVIIDVDVSMWIVLVTFLLALFLILAKRRDEYLHYVNGKIVRKNIDGYNLDFLNAGMVLLATVTLVSYNYVHSISRCYCTNGKR
jgi:4-hydroxybenzoate polyprenyltransferase